MPIFRAHLRRSLAAEETDTALADFQQGCYICHKPAILICGDCGKPVCNEHLQIVPAMIDVYMRASPEKVVIVKIVLVLCDLPDGNNCYNKYIYA